MISTALGRALGRFLALAVTGTALVLAGVAAAAPASAYEDRGVGVRQGSGLSTAEILLTFVGIPALIFVVCAGLVYGLSSNRDARLRADRAQWSGPDYYAAGGTPARTDSDGGDAADAGTAASGGDAGGTSARW